MKRRLAAVCLTLAALVSAVAQEASPLHGPRASAVALKPCKVGGSEGLCGTYEVWENREAASGRKIAVNIAVLPAMGSKTEPDPIFFFAGGPGQGATETAGLFGPSFADARRKRDLVFVDQRGTGGSNPLRCDVEGPAGKPQTWLVDMFPPEYVDACRRKLEKIADLTLYTTPIAMDDIDEVRAALGYDKINLYGGSYGTRAAAVYMRRHPQTVRAAVLGGAASVFHGIPSTFAQDAQRALDLLIHDCRANADCNRAFPDVRGDLDKALARLRRGPVTVEIPNPYDEDAPKETVKLALGPFISGVRSMLYNARNSGYLPLFVHEAAKGNWMPIAQYSARYMRGVKTAVADGLYLSVTCAEDIPFFNATAARKQSRGTFLGDYRVAQQVGACARWPRGVLPDGFSEPVRSDAPVLVLSGELDPVTPPHSGEAAMLGFKNGRHIVVANTAHGMYGPPWTSCIGEIVARFFETGSPEGLDASCAFEIERPPFQLELPF